MTQAKRPPHIPQHYIDTYWRRPDKQWKRMVSWESPEVLEQYLCKT